MTKLNEEERLVLFEENNDLAYYIAHKYNVGMEIEDTKQEALMALWIATEKFNPERSDSFATYAYWIISSALQQNIVRNRRIMAVPRSATGDVELVDMAGLEEDKQIELSYRPRPDREIDIKTALNSLKEPLNLIYNMRLDGYKVREIGEALGYSKQSVNAYLQQANAQLTKLYGDNDE